MRLPAEQVSAIEDEDAGWPAVDADAWDEATPVDERWQGWLSLTAVAAVVAALVSPQPTDLGQFGLPPALPFIWYAALAVLMLGAVLVLSLREFKPWLAGFHLVGLIIALYGTGVVLAGAPRFAWSYKHIGVTNYITQFGHVDPGVDIYHRWPGFFSLASAFGAVAGLPDAADYAGFAGVLFVLLEALLVVAIGRTLLGSTRAGWAAGLVFACLNFVGQDYFAPQPFAFVLALGVLWLTLLHFQRAPEGRLFRAGARLLARVSRSDVREARIHPVEPLWGRRTALGVVTLLFVAIVPSHQLTPYIVVLVLATFAVVKGLEPRWIPLLFAALAVLYLVPNFDFLESRYQVFSGIDPFANAESVNDLTRVDTGKRLNVRAGQILAVTFGLVSLIALIRAWRREQAGVLHAGLAFLAPFLILLSLNYGGEGSVRVILFAAPWAAVLIASAIVLRRPERNLLLAPVLALFLALFLPAYYGAEEVNRIPPSEVTASEFLYANGEEGSVVVGSAPNFPTRAGARYTVLRGERGTSDPVLTRRHEFRQRGLGPANVSTVVDVIHQYSRRGYVVFSQSQETYAEIFGVSTVEDLRSLENAMVASGRFRIFYQNQTTRIYELIG